MDSKTRLGAILLLALAMSSCDKTPKPTEAPATRVKIEVVDTTAQNGGRSYSGTIEESSGSVLSFAVAGTICRMNVSVGDYVAKGQLIATLDTATLHHAHEIARATLNQAQDAYNRMGHLHEANALPDIKWVEVQNALSQAQNAEAIARRALDDANFYAPQAGYVSEKIADTGMNVAPGMPVVKLVDITPVKVSIAVPENEISGIEPNSVIRITVSALGGKSYIGHLAEKGVSANPLSRSYDVKFEVPNLDKELLPGMICDALMDADSVRNVIAVPIDAILLDADNRNFVYVAKNGKADKRLVVTDGMTSGSRIIIKSGLLAGDSIIVCGQQKVSQGTCIVDIN